MNGPPLAAFETIIDASGIARRIEAMLPIGVRARQLSVRTLLLGIMITHDDQRPAHLTRIHQALTGLPAGEQRRLAVTTDWKNGPHLLTYRQTERTFGLIASALGNQDPGGLPSPGLQRACDDLLEASIPEEIKSLSASLAVDWTDVESFSRPPPHDAGPGDCADPEASWGHRTVNLLLPGAEDHHLGGVRDADEKSGISGGLVVVVPGLVGEVPGWRQIRGGNCRVRAGGGPERRL